MAVDVCRGVDVVVENWIFCAVIGDWHLLPLGEDTGELTKQLEVVVEG